MFGSTESSTSFLAAGLFGSIMLAVGGYFVADHMNSKKQVIEDADLREKLLP